MLMLLATMVRATTTTTPFNPSYPADTPVGSPLGGDATPKLGSPTESPTEEPLESVAAPSTCIAGTYYNYSSFSCVSAPAGRICGVFLFLILLHALCLKKEPVRHLLVLRKLANVRPQCILEQLFARPHKVYRFTVDVASVCCLNICVLFSVCQHLHREHCEHRPACWIWHQRRGLWGSWCIRGFVGSHVSHRLLSPSCAIRQLQW
jgi:hypothetical protein